MSGALQSDEVSVYYLSSWPVHPYRTATSLLIDCNATMSLHNVTSKLHLLLKHIEEVSSVTVEGEETRLFVWSYFGAFFFLQRNDILVEFCEWFMLQRTRCSGKNYSVVPQFPSPTTSIWVTVICGMFPAIAENNTRASAYTLTHAHAHMHAEILIMSQSYLLHLHKRHINLTHSNTHQNVLSQFINFLLYNLDNVLSLSFSIAELLCF